MNQFCYKSKWSYNDMGLILSESSVNECPERDIEFVEVPGRSGDIIIDNGRYKNVSVSYKVTLIFAGKNPQQRLSDIKAWLAKDCGYFKLYDTYDPLHYRMAVVSGSFDIAKQLNAVGVGTIKFNCKPFKYRFQNTLAFSAPKKLINPEAWGSVPYIKIIGSGDITLSINEKSYAFSNVDEYIEIDGELMAAYKGTQLQNDKIHFTEFPTLAPGTNNISFSGNVTEIQINPRWRTL